MKDPESANRYKPVSCDFHDLIEIACLYRYRLQISTADGDICGTATDTRIDDSKNEFLLLRNDDRELIVRLDRILQMKVLTEIGPAIKKLFAQHPGSFTC